MRLQYLMMMVVAGLSGCDGDHEELQQWMARMVPSMTAVSGMMLLVVPALMRPTVTTVGSLEFRAKRRWQLK